MEVMVKYKNGKRYDFNKMSKYYCIHLNNIHEILNKGVCEIYLTAKWVSAYMKLEKPGFKA